MTNINKLVHDYIDNDISIKKLLSANLVNISSLARKIATEHNLMNNIDAVISAIRRYDKEKVKITRQTEIYELLKQTRMSTRNRLSSILIEKHQTIRDDVKKAYSEINFSAGETLKIFELESFVKLIVDEKNHDKIIKLFNSRYVSHTTKNICEITLSYPKKIIKTPGVFALISQELANNEISIVDSMICHFEHLIILDVKDYKKAFDVINKLIV